jgi:hypothetical protein
MQVRITPWKDYERNKVSNSHAIHPRTSANVLVISVKTLVILLVKLTKSGIGGGPWGGLPPLRGASSQAVFQEDNAKLST